MSATSGGSVSEGSEAGGSSQSTMSVGDSPSTSFQTNLAAENVTKITLSEENIPGSFGTDMTGSKINLSLDEKQQQDGIVNAAFDYDEGAIRTSAGGGVGITAGGISGSGAGMGISGGGAGMGGGASAGAGGDFRSINGSDKKDKVPEAVNLELVNMVPYSNGNGTSYGVPVNGIPMKKDTEQVDMSTPYDEYFVPVNEHKKYMRGEKLYVTKDKRRPTSWRRCLSWIVACTVISVVLILAILAGTGVILSQEPNLVKEASVGRNFAGSNLKPSVTNKSPTPTAEMYKYVPRSIESEFVIDNLDFDPAFKDINSTAYQQFATSMEDQLKMFLFDKETLEFGASNIGLKIVNVSRDPFKVNYRIGWNYKQGVNNPPEPIKMEDVKNRLVKSLTRNQGYIDKYHIDKDAIKVNHVINTCQMDNGGCSHICYYNYNTQQFVCTCPTHLVLDNSGKNCVAWTGSSEDDGLPVPSQTTYPGIPYESTANPVQEEEIDAHYKHEPAAEPAPEPTAEPGRDAKDGSFRHSEDGIHSFHDTDDAAAPEPTAEPDAKNKYDHSHPDHADHNHSDHAYSDHDMQSVHESREPSSEPEPEPTAEPNLNNQDQPTHFLHGIKDHEPSAEPTPEPTSDHTGEQNSEGRSHDPDNHSFNGFKDREPSAEPTPEPAPEPTSEGKDHNLHFMYGSKDMEQEGEPTPEPSPESKDQDNSTKDHEPAAEPTPEPAPEPTAAEDSGVYHGDKDHDNTDHSVYAFREHEPSAEPTPEPAPEPTATRDSNGNAQDNLGHSVYESKQHEFDAQATPEPTVTEDSSENVQTGHSIHESKEHSSVESTSEPTVTEDSSEKDHDHIGHSIHESKEHEPSAEPTSEPTVTEDSREKTLKYAGHSINGSEDESSAEPTPEPTVTEDSSEKDHDHTGHSIHKSKEHEPLAEPTPEPTVTEDSSEKTLNHAGHSIYGSEKPVAEPTLELTATEDSIKKDHSVYGSKDNEPIAEPTSEPTPDSESSGKNDDSGARTTAENQGQVTEPKTESTPEYSSKEQHVHSMSDVNDHETEPQPTPEPGFDVKESKLYSGHTLETTGVKTNSEPASETEPTPEPSPEGDASSVRSDHIEITTHPIQDHMISGQGVTSRELKMESQTEHPTGSPPSNQNESVEETKSMHRAPHLEDILIRQPASGNTTERIHNPLENVELTENGKPVIEEIILNNSGGPSADQTEFSSVSPSHFDNEFYSTSTTTESSNNGSVGDSYDSTTRVSVTVPGSGVQTDSPHPVTRVSTDIPKIIEYDATHHLASQNKVNSGEAEKSTSASTENPSESTVSSDLGLSSPNVNTGVTRSGQSQNSGTPIEESMPVTTLHPEIKHEYQTMSAQPPGEARSETKSKEEGNTETPASTIMGEGSNRTDSLTENERPSIMDTTHNISGGQVNTEGHETVTEQQTAATTLLTILTPEGVGKITSELTKEMAPKELEEENKTINVRQSQLDKNETTKSPEEISNNIKDELTENEEFNTLIDEEYKNKDGNLGEGKEVISKYPNKSLKTDKKRIKDYVKGEKIEPEKKGEVTPRPGVTSEDFFLQKHVNGNENIYDLDFSLQNEHTTKPEGEVTVTDPHAIDGVPGVSFKPHGINNHDISVLQTVAPDFRTETIIPTGAQDQETPKLDSKTKFPDSKEVEFKTDKDYPKFDKDYKYEKQKVPKKKDLKKKIGGKDGKNVELEDGRKFHTEVSKEELDVSNEENLGSTIHPLDKVTVQPELKRQFTSEVTAIPEYKVNSDGNERNSSTVEIRTETPAAGITDLPSFKRTEGSELPKEPAGGNGKPEPNLISISVDRKGHLTVDEPTVKNTSNVSPGTVYDGQLPGAVNSNNGGMMQAISNLTITEHRRLGTVFDGIPQPENTSSIVDQTPGSLPKVVSDGESETVNSTTAHPTIRIHGQSGNLQDGHAVRFANSNLFNPANATVVSAFNGTHPEGYSFSFTNDTATFPNGSAVHPTIVVRGQSGTLQDGHKSRFENATFASFVTNSSQPGFKSSNVYRIENETLPGTVTDGYFDLQNWQYIHTVTNSTETLLNTNEATTQPAFIIKGVSGDFGNSTAYIISNNTRTGFSGGFVGPESVVFRNSTVFAVENDASGALQGVTPKLQGDTNETILFTKQMSPSFVSSGTAYKVNDYFGYISKCASGQFQCINGTSKRGSACISLSSKCDSIPDCSDGSDELGCIENGCPGNFQCSDGSCLKRNLVCNGILDCSDQSDEKNCENWKCEFDEFQCPSGRCIPVVWQCDGKPDCDNHTDEYNCQTSCGNDEYLCPEGWCIPLTYKCNGVRECSNGEDEQLCDCSHDEFKCQTGGCVSTKNVCDGLDDCPDRSDEWDCVKLEPESNLLKIRSATGDYAPVCADRWSSRYSDEVCASLGYFSSVPIENENGSSITTDSSFYVLKNDTTVDFNKKIIINLRKGDGICTSGKLVEISCQEFSCGSRSMTDSSSVEARLVGGMSAASGQWPSVALLYNVRNLHSCTANVLTPRWVLASYNCLKMGNKNLNEQDWKFFGGSTVFETEKENAETRKILRIIPHPQLKFNQFLFTNDLALVELDQSLQFTSKLGAVCLPEQEIQPRQICVTAGWGMNAPQDKTIKQQLQYLPVPTMNLTECNSTEHYSGFITNDKICAGYNSAQKSLCYNEEGAPLMCVNDGGEWELQGVLSYHSNCGRGSHPSIFSSITQVADWIKKTIGNNFDRKTLPVTKR